MKIYYAHAIPLYDTVSEMAELGLIMRTFPGAEIVNPKEHQPIESADEMEHFKSLVRDCDCLVFSRFMGKITAGVGIEANYAIDLGKDVYAIKGQELKRVNRHVKSLSYEETLRLIGRAYSKLTFGNSAILDKV